MRERVRDLGEAAARERRALEGLAVECAEAVAESEAAAESGRRGTARAEQLRPEVAAAEARLAAAEGEHAEALSLVTRRSVELEERRAAAQRAAAQREAARRRAAAGRARLEELERRLDGLPQVREICEALASCGSRASAGTRRALVAAPRSG